MSEVTKPVEETPVAVEAPEQPEVSKADMAVPETEVDAPTAAAAESAPAPIKEVTEETINKGEALVEATPASEGVLGYKAPGLKQLLPLRYKEHYFWFSDEPLTSEALTGYVHGEKRDEVKHHNASWAQETGKGFLFFSKRAEDKATPAGLIPLADVTDVFKEGVNDFSFKSAHHTYKFQAATTEERASWLVAIEKKSEEAKAMKPDIIGSEGYKKNLKTYATAPLAPAVVAAASKHDTTTPKKSLDASTAVAATNGTTAETETPADKETKAKSRSQSRKRTSIFGSLLGKKEEREEVKKEEKAEDKTDKEAEHEHQKDLKAEKKAEKEKLKEEKKAEAHAKKEEAKKEHDAAKAKEAAEAAAIAAVPAAAIAAEEKKTEKTEETTGSTTPTDKKSKRGSVFGIFGKKGVTGPTAEKTEKEVAPVVPAKDAEVPPVSETAPKLDEPIENKPIDAAAVTAPIDTATTPAIADEATEEPISPPAETSTPSKSEEKGGFLGGLIKKAESAFASKKEHKSEHKEEEAAETIAKDPVVAAAPTETTAAATETTPPPTAQEERPVREKRRTSLFSSLGTLKKKDAESTSDAEGAAPVETKREKSPLPAKLGALFRRPSKATKLTGETKPVSTETAAEPAVNGVSAPAATDSAIVGDVVPEEMHAPIHDAVTMAPSEVKATA